MADRCGLIGGRINCW